MRWLKAWFKRRAAAGPAASRVPPEWQRARELIAAVDAGGLPLNPARVNDIARRLGLDVSSRAAVEDTIVRIRHALERTAP